VNKKKTRKEEEDRMNDLAKVAARDSHHQATAEKEETMCALCKSCRNCQFLLLEKVNCRHGVCVLHRTKVNVRLQYCECFSPKALAPIAVKVTEGNYVLALPKEIN
jgi:hypothetical protein